MRIEYIIPRKLTEIQATDIYSWPPVLGDFLNKDRLSSNHKAIILFIFSLTVDRTTIHFSNL